MPSLIERSLNSPRSLALAAGIGRLTPTWLGYLLTDALAGVLASQRSSPTVRAVRANQWVARGQPQDSQAMDQAVRLTFRNSARAIFDLYHHLHDMRHLGQQVVMDENTQALVSRAEFAAQGLLVVGLHLSRFDLLLYWFARQGFRPLIITIPHPEGGRRVEFEARKRSGINLVPASPSAMRQSVELLQQGGVVVTGIDRPVPEPRHHPRFFGRPSVLPTHHVVLALKAQVPVVLMVTFMEADGKHHLYTSEYITMEPGAEREQEKLANAEKILAVAERYIRRAPEQWSISLPVWPEALDQAPGA